MLPNRFTDPGSLSDGMVRLSLKSYQEEVDESKGHVPFYEFEVIEESTGLPAGGIVLRVGYTAHVDMCAGHIGYGIDEAFRGRRFAAKSVKLLCTFAKRIGMPYVVITTRPDNAASRRSAEIAGFTFEGDATVPEQDEMFAEGERVMHRFVLRFV